MFWASWYQSMSTYSQPSFSSFTRYRGEVWTCKWGMISPEQLKMEVKVLLSANRKSYIPVSWHNNGWPWVTLNGCIVQYLCSSWAVLVFTCTRVTLRRSLTVSFIQMIQTFWPLEASTAQSKSGTWQHWNRLCRQYDLFAVHQMWTYSKYAQSDFSFN